jgi:hypothetical protein
LFAFVARQGISEPSEIIVLYLKLDQIKREYLPGPVTVAFITPSPASFVITRNSATSPVRTPFG